MDPLIDLLLLLATASNTWFLVKLYHKRTFTDIFVFLVHLTVCDIFHDLHASGYLLATTELWEFDHNARELFLRINQCLGFIIIFIPLLAVMAIFIQSLLHGITPESIQTGRTKRQFVKKVTRQQAALWCAASAMAVPLFFQAEQIQLSGPYQISPVFPSHPSGIIFPSKSPGISSELGVPQNWLILSWSIAFECLSNPLWFPLACLCLLPLLAFFLLKREVAEAGGKTRLVRQEEQDSEEDRTPHRRLMAMLLVLYYLVFVYDLLSLDAAVDRCSFTHVQRKSDGQMLVCYVFHYWTRPAATVTRNIIIAITWRLNAKRKRKELVITSV